MPRLASNLALALLLVASAACGPKPGVARAKSLLDSGDYRGANAAADEELAGSPDVAELWRIKIRAQLLLADTEGAVATYERWKKRLGSDDAIALGDMAELTLWRGLVTPSPELNIKAITAIEKHQLVRLADEVTALIASDDDVVAATAAVAVLRDHPQAASVAAARLSSPNPAARATVIRGISRKILQRAEKEIRAATSDSAPEVRRAGIAGVVLLRDRADTSLLAKIARTDADETMRARAARALAQKPYFPDVELARVLSRDSFIGGRLAAVELAKYLSERGGRDVLREASRSEELAVAMRAAVLLGSGPAWKPLFEKALASEEWPTRAAALSAVLAATDRETSLAAAARGAGDSKIGVRLAAARLFVRLGDKESAEPIFAAAISGETPDLGAAVTLARDFGRTDARAVIAKAVTSDERKRRTAAIAALARLPRTGAIEPALVRALTDKAPALRLQAAEALLDLLK